MQVTTSCSRQCCQSFQILIALTEQISFALVLANQVLPMHAGATVVDLSFARRVTEAGNNTALPASLWNTASTTLHLHPLVTTLIGSINILMHSVRFANLILIKCAL